MTTQNDVTGDTIKSKATSDKYRDNWDNIFKKEKEVSTNATYTIDEHGMATVTIPKSTYDRLKDRETKLECLEAAGVDNWVGFDDAMDMYTCIIYHRGD